MGRKRERALLVINTTSGPNDDSIRHLPGLVDLLAAHGIDVDVCVKLSKRQARKDVRAFAKKGRKLVIAAGGDGTIEAVARGLLGTKAVLGIVPLGTYNNVAASLGVPSDMAEAVALIAAGPTRRVDVGMVRCSGRREPKPFLELVSIGVGAALAPAGQEAKDGNWLAAAEMLTPAVDMELAAITVRLDRDEPPLRARTLSVTVSNTPRSGAAMTMAPDARVDDGVLDVTVYRDMAQAALTLHFAAKGTVGESEDERVQRVQARRIDVRADPPLPVAAGVKVIGETPARIEVLPGALRVICGNGPGLSQPVSGALVAAAVAEAGSIPGTPATEAGDASVGARALEAAGTAARAVVAAVAQRVAGSGENGPGEDQPETDGQTTPARG